MAPGRSADAILSAAVLLLGLLLCLIGSAQIGQLEDAAARQQEPGVEDLLAAGTTVAGAGITAWWIIALACAAASALLDRKGRIRAAAATRRLSPAFMQRLVLGALSVQLLSGPVAHAAVTGPGPEWAPTQGESSSAPVIPGTEGTRTEAGTGEEAGPAGSGASPTASVAEPVPQQMPVHAPRAGGDTPTAAPEQVPVREQDTAVEAIAASGFHPGWQPAAPVVEPGMLAAPATRTPSGVEPQVEGVTVQAGDTLWDIAAHHLGHGASDLDVALQWPRWYEANRALIGKNPDVLLPGQILQPPSAGRK